MHGGDGGDTNRTRTLARAPVVVYLDDVNDNAPRFTSAAYDVQLPENATAGVRVTTVEAVDLDTGLFGSVRYTAVLGFKNSSLVLDPITGVIVVSNDNHGFDREESTGKQQEHVYSVLFVNINKLKKKKTKGRSRRFQMSMYK